MRFFLISIFYGFDIDNLHAWQIFRKYSTKLRWLALEANEAQYAIIVKGTFKGISSSLQQTRKTSSVTPLLLWQQFSLLCFTLNSRANQDSSVINLLRFDGYPFLYWLKLRKSSLIGYTEPICIDSFDQFAEPKTFFKWIVTMKLELSSQYRAGRS